MNNGRSRYNGRHTNITRTKYDRVPAYWEPLRAWTASVPSISRWCAPGRLPRVLDLPGRCAPSRVASGVHDRWHGHARGQNHVVFCGGARMHSLARYPVRDGKVGPACRRLRPSSSWFCHARQGVRRWLACGQLAHAGWFAHAGRVTALHPQHRLSHGAGCQHYWSHVRMDRSRQLGPASHLQHQLMRGAILLGLLANACARVVCFGRWSCTDGLGACLDGP